MQVVGKACDVCRARITSEIDAVACLRCVRAFHDSCVTPKPASTYRAVPPSSHVGPTSPPSTLCPTCGDDVRLLQRNRDEVAALDRARLREAAQRARVGSPDIVSILKGRLVVTLVVAAAGALLYWLGYA